MIFGEHLTRLTLIYLLPRGGGLPICRRLTTCPTKTSEYRNSGSVSNTISAMQRLFLRLVCSLMLCSAATDSRHVTKTDVDRWMQELSNWGRWGEGRPDRRGESDHSSQAQQAAALVQEGVSISLARDTEKQKAIDNGSPFRQVVSWTEKNGSAQFELDEYSGSLSRLRAHAHGCALPSIHQWQSLQRRTTEFDNGRGRIETGGRQF